MDISSMSSDSILSMVAGGMLVLVLFLFFLLLVIFVFQIIGLWKTFSKANKPGWAAIVPVYNTFVLLETAKMDWRHIFGVIISLGLYEYFDGFLSIIFGIVYFVYFFIININLCKAFNKTTGFGVFTSFFPFIGYMILGCGNATYEE